MGPPASDHRHVAATYGSRVVLLDHHGNHVWDVPVDGDRYNAPPLLAGDKLILPGDPVVTALRRSDGAQLWRTVVADDTYSSTPSAANGRIFVSTWDDQLLALDEDDGTVLWTVPTGPHPYGSPAIAGDMVVQSWQGGWSAFAADSGAVAWSEQLADGDTSPAIVRELADGRWLAAVLAADGSARAVDAASGELLWAAPARSFGGSPHVQPVADGDNLVFADKRAGLVALDTATGARVWAGDGPGVAWYGSPAALGDGVVVMPVDAGYAYVAERGNKRFTVGAESGLVHGVAKSGPGFVLTTAHESPPLLVAFHPPR